MHSRYEAIESLRGFLFGRDEDFSRARKRHDVAIRSYQPNVTSAPIGCTLIAGFQNGDPGAFRYHFSRLDQYYIDTFEFPVGSELMRPPASEMAWGTAL